MASKDALETYSFSMGGNEQINFRGKPSKLVEQTIISFRSNKDHEEPYTVVYEGLLDLNNGDNLRLRQPVSDAKRIPTGLYKVIGSPIDQLDIGGGKEGMDKYTRCVQLLRIE